MSGGRWLERHPIGSAVNDRMFAELEEWIWGMPGGTAVTAAAALIKAGVRPSTSWKHQPTRKSPKWPSAT